jgi:hypothetical protein
MLSSVAAIGERNTVITNNVYAAAGFFVRPKNTVPTLICHATMTKIN